MSGAIPPLSPHASAQPALAANTNAANTSAANAANKNAAAAKANIDKLRHAATEFESILVKQLVKAAKLGGSADKGNGYADMTVDALASAIERGGGLGLSHRIEEAIGKNVGSVSVEDASAARNVHKAGSQGGG